MSATGAVLVQRAHRDIVIVGNELNALDRRPGVDQAALVERYLHRTAMIHAAVRAASPGTRLQLYGEASFGGPDDPQALLRRHGLGARIHWSASVEDEPVAGPRPLLVPPYTFGCDTRRQQIHPSQAAALTVELPESATAGGGGAVRTFP
ncbi:MAG TPA: hypothetical protein VHS99_25705 [Chloroflexota bacterium]|nr:hypothetical protein [Chloroflexota bacterium]